MGKRYRLNEINCVWIHMKRMPFSVFATANTEVYNLIHSFLFVCLFVFLSFRQAFSEKKFCYCFGVT